MKSTYANVTWTLTRSLKNIIILNLKQWDKLKKCKYIDHRTKVWRILSSDCKLAQAGVDGVEGVDGVDGVDWVEGQIEGVGIDGVQDGKGESQLK